MSVHVLYLTSEIQVLSYLLQCHLSTCLCSPQDSPEELERSHRYVLVGAEGGGGMSAHSPVETCRGGAAALLFAEPQTVQWY